MHGQKQTTGLCLCVYFCLNVFQPMANVANGFQQGGQYQVSSQQVYDQHDQPYVFKDGEGFVMVWAHCGKKIWFWTGQCYCVCVSWLNILCFVSVRFIFLFCLFYIVLLHKVHVYLFPFLFCFVLFCFFSLASRDALFLPMTQPSSEMELLLRMDILCHWMCFKTKEEKHCLWPLLNAPRSYIWPPAFFLPQPLSHSLGPVLLFYVSKLSMLLACWESS